MDSNLTIGHNSFPRNRRGWAIVRSSALLLTAQAATSREDASSEQSLALMIDWEFDTTAAAEGLLAKLRDLWARPWQDCYAEPVAWIVERIKVSLTRGLLDPELS